jgi:thiol-disulfide isomerase/thioredoxin
MAWTPKTKLMKINTERIFLLAAAAVLCLAGFGCEQQQSVQAPPPPRDKEICTTQLETIYQAIQAYRRDHKDIPMWLTDLVPKYIADTNLLICPITRKTGQTHTFEHLKDPRMPTAYLYEFSPLPMGGVWNGGQIRMRDFKRRQMGLVGGEVAMVRCHLHQPVLNLAFDGHIYESPLGWEDNFTNVVDVTAWRLENLFRDAPTLAPPVPQPTPVIEPPKQRDLTGEPAPEFTLPILGEGTFALAAHQDKDIVLLDFWASWCGPCRMAMPVLVDVAKQYADKGVRYFAINLREEPQTIRRYLKEAQLDITVPLDKDGSAARQYGVSGIPTMVIVGKDGLVEAVHVGASPNLKSELTSTLDRLLAGENPGDLPRPSSAVLPRGENVTPLMVDLSDYFHAALTESWHPGNEGNDLAKLPSGVQTLEGVPFDIRGVVQLNGGGMVDMQGKNYPRRVKGIKIGRKCERLHFLHAAGWAVDDGTLVGKYVLRYADGSRQALPIIYGEDIRDWWVGTDKVVELKHAKVAWQGQTSNGSEVRVYTRTWENPNPDREVASIDFISSMTRCAPFLLAITTEP